MFFLAIIDMSIASFVITPLVVSFWRGTWEYIRCSTHFPVSWTLYVSTVLHVAFTILREPLYEKKRPGILGLFIARIYIYIFAIVGITQWRAMFDLLDTYLDTNRMAFSALVCAVILVGSNTIATLVGPPFVIFLDHRQKDVFIYPTLFNRNSTENVWFYLLDCGFSVCVIGTLVVFVWRGTWSLLDHYIYPGSDRQALSAWSSLGLGYAIVAISFLLQPPMKYLAKTLTGVMRLAAVDLYLFFSFCGTVNVWRGVWNVLNIYLFPENPALSYGLSHAVPFFLLVLINSSNSILVRGVYIDGEENGSQCVDFPCYYLRLFFQAKRKKRLLREASKGRRSEGETLVQVIPVECDWKKPSSNGPESNQLLSSP